MEKKYKCNFCDKVFSSSQSKCNHISIYHKDEKNKQSNITEIKCIHCNKIFTLKSSLSRHLKNNCKIKNNFIKNISNENIIENENENKDIILDKDILEDKQCIFNDKVNITINNIQNNIININPYKNPNMNNFNLLDICNIFEHEFNMVLKLIEVTYFNKKLEENHCFNVSNLRGEYVNTIESTKLKKYFFDELFGIILKRVKVLYKKYKNKLFEIPKQLKIQEKIEALEDIRNQNTPSYKSYLKLINVLAYDKKDIVNNTWNKLKNKQILNKSNDDIIWDRNIEI